MLSRPICLLTRSTLLRRTMSWNSLVFYRPPKPPAGCLWSWVFLLQPNRILSVRKFVDVQPYMWPWDVALHGGDYTQVWDLLSGQLHFWPPVPSVGFTIGIARRFYRHS